MDDNSYQADSDYIPAVNGPLKTHKGLFYSENKHGRQNRDRREDDGKIIDFPEKQYHTYIPNRKPILRGVPWSSEVLHSKVGELVYTGSKRRAVPFSMYRRSREWDVLQMSKMTDWDTKMPRSHYLKALGVEDADVCPYKRPLTSSLLQINLGPSNIINGIETRPILRRSPSPESTSRFSQDSSSNGSNSQETLASQDEEGGVFCAEEFRLTDDGYARPIPARQTRRPRSMPILGETFIYSVSNHEQARVGSGFRSTGIAALSLESPAHRIYSHAEFAEAEDASSEHRRFEDALDLACSIYHRSAMSNQFLPNSHAERAEKQKATINRKYTQCYNYQTRSELHGEVKQLRDKTESASDEQVQKHSHLDDEQHSNASNPSRINTNDIGWDEEFEHTEAPNAIQDSVGTLHVTIPKISTTSQEAEQYMQIAPTKQTQNQDEVEGDHNTGQEIPLETIPLIRAKFAVENLFSSYEDISEEVNPVVHMGDLGGAKNDFTRDLIFFMLWRLGHVMNERDYCHSYHNAKLIQNVTRQLRQELSRETVKLKERSDKADQANAYLHHYVNRIIEQCADERRDLRKEAERYERKLLSMIGEKRVLLEEKTLQVNAMRKDSESLMKTLQVLSQRNEKLRKERRALELKSDSLFRNGDLEIQLSPPLSIKEQSLWSTKETTNQNSTSTPDITETKATFKAHIHVTRALNALAEARRLANKSATYRARPISRSA